MKRIMLILLALAPVPAWFLMRERRRRKAAQVACRKACRQARDAVDRQIAAEYATADVKQLVRRLEADLEAERMVAAVREKALASAERQLQAVRQREAWRDESVRGERMN